MTTRVPAAGGLMICGLMALFPAFGAVRYVAAGASLQQALNEAVLGDTIILQAGAVYTGNFVLPKKTTGTGWITIQSSLVDALPPAGQRVTPSHASSMPKLMSPNAAAVIGTAAGAHHFRLVGLELSAPAGVYTMNLIALGSGTETSLADLPYSIELDRLYLHGDPKVGGKRGISLNSRSTNITNCWLSDFKSTSQETQALGGWNGPGPYQIVNNYIEASGVNLMFGGSRARIANLVPSDIVVRKNHFFKPLSWNASDPSFAGVTWVVKNLFELKNARRVTIDGNVFENNWAQSQAGFAFQFTVRTENGAMPWAVVEDVTLSNNIVLNSPSGINALGTDGSYGGALRRLTIKNNVFEGMTARFVQLLHRCENVVIDHNTAFTGKYMLLIDGAPSPGLVFKNNISNRGSYGGIFGSGSVEGTISLAQYAPGAIVTKNVIAGASPSKYPAGNYFPASVYDVRFVDALGHNFTLAADSPYRGLGTDGRDLGVNQAALNAATLGAVKLQ